MNIGKFVKEYEVLPIFVPQRKESGPKESPPSAPQPVKEPVKEKELVPI